MRLPTPTFKRNQRTGFVQGSQKVVEHLNTLSHQKKG